MSDKIKVQNVLTAVKRMALDVVERLKKMDRRLLIMIASAVVLLLIVIVLIASGVNANKKDIPKAEPSTEDVAVRYNEPDTNANNTVVAVGAGKYKVNTGSDADLNMRRAAGRTYDLITRIPNGTVVDVLFVDDQVDAKGWGYIRYNGDSGWVSMEYLTPAP